MKKINRIIRILSIFFIAISLTAILPFSAFCADNTDEIISSSADKTNSENSLYNEIFNTISENSSEILSALSFIGSIIIMFTYKKGLVPIVKDGIFTLNNKVKNIGDKTDGFEKSVTEITDDFSKKLSDAQELLSGLETAIEEFKSEKEEKEKMKKDSETLKTVLITEIELLYEIFMSATLPEYLKERVGEKISDMKSKLNEAEALRKRDNA